jgi:Tol biopolymer transport system component
VKRLFTASYVFLLVAFLAGLSVLSAQEQSPKGSERFVTPNENLVVDGVPPVPASLADTIGRYTENRRALPTDWHPTRREMLISTRFGNTYQAHLVKFPGGMRQQLTFSDETVRDAEFHPNGGDYFVYRKDTGGGEWYQLYRYDLATSASTLLTDGKSRNSNVRWSTSGDQIAYVSTRRTGQDNDLWVMNPSDPKTDHLVAQLSGGGWDALDWSKDDKKILMVEGLSVNESYLWIVDAASGEKIELTPRKTEEKISYASAAFSKDGKGVYLTTDKDSEFQRLEYLDLATKKTEVLTPGLDWDVSDFAQSWNGKWIAYLVNEDGVSKLHLLNTAARSRPLHSSPQEQLPA